MHAFGFQYTNGTFLPYGNIANNAITQINSVSLLNWYISAVFLRSASWIDSIKFELTNKITNAVALTPQFGGNGGSLSSLNFKTLNASHVEIKQFSGYCDNTLVRQFKIGYSYKICQ